MKFDSTPEGYHQEHLVPEGEFKCIWMNAGVISYKLCEYEYQCEMCPFDMAMRRHGMSPPPTSTHAVQSGVVEAAEGKVGWQMMEDLLAPFQQCTPHLNLYYHCGHTWVNTCVLNGVKIGLDDFAVKVLPKASVVLTRAPQCRIAVGHPCCWIVKDDRVLPIAAPLNGVILSVNSQISEQSDLLYQDPYGEGWLMTIKPDNLQEDLKNLMFGETVFLWYQQDVATFRRLFIPILADSSAAIGQTLCDGGERQTNLCDVLGAKRYFEIIQPWWNRNV